MKKISIALAALFAVAGAQADTVPFTEGFGLATTNWVDALNSSQFNPALGTLTGVSIRVFGDIVQNIAAENLGATPDTLTPIAGGLFQFRKNTTVGGSTTLASPGSSFAASAFDGVDDKAGTSGISFSGLTAAGDFTVTFSGAALADFIGTGDLSAFNIRAVGGGSVDSDNGNLSTVITTQARYRLEGLYTFDPAPVTTVPEPTSLALVGLALAGLGYASRRKA